MIVHVKLLFDEDTMIFERNFWKIIHPDYCLSKILFNFGNKNTLRRRAANTITIFSAGPVATFVGSDPAELRAGFVALAL